MAPGGGASSSRLDDRDRMSGLAEELRQARRLVGGEHDPGAVALASASTASARRAGPAGGRTGSRQPNGLPDAAPPRAIATSSGGSDSQVSSSVRDATSRRFQSRGPR